MTDMNSQSKPGGSSQGRKNDKPKELTGMEQWHEDRKKAAIEAHQREAREKDDDINYTD